MNNTRRTILKGLAATGLGIQSLVHGGTSLAMQQDKSLQHADIMHLVITPSDGNKYISSSFIAGVKSVNPGRYFDLSLDDLASGKHVFLNKNEADNTKINMVGLVDNAVGTVLLDLVRTSGGSIEFIKDISLPDSYKSADKAKLLGSQIVKADLSAVNAYVNEIDGARDWIIFKCAV